MTEISHFSHIKAFVTKDGSLIRELMHPDVHGNQNQSLAEATIPAGAETLLHRHNISEELYHITQGEGIMTLSEKTFFVTSGDTVCIKPGQPHKIRNTGSMELRILCCCSPAYSHQDTTILEHK